MKCVHTNHRQSASNLWTSVRNQSSVYFHLIPTERPVKAIINPKSSSSKINIFWAYHEMKYMSLILNSEQRFH